jgi:hypothetical protein
MFDRSYLKKTGQLWKLQAAAVLTGVGGVPMLLGWSTIEPPPTSSGPALILLVVGTVIIVAAGVWAVWAIACPACRTKLLWRAVAKQSSGLWLHWLVGLTACPSCGATGSATATESTEPR